MSSRAARRSQAASYGLPGVPIAEIRTRKWTKQVKTVGHLSIPKWIPDQENPTEALQRGAFKKTKGRKRGAGEVGRMTRSVRQHLDAPLELLHEIPNLRQLSRQSSPARTVTALSTPARTPVPMPLPDATPVPAAVVATIPAESLVQGSIVAATDAAPVKVDSFVAVQPGLPPKPEVVSAVVPAPTLSLIPMMPPMPNQMMTDDEQLEMVLDDLPILDADDSFNLDVLDPAFLPHPAPTHTNAPAGSQGVGQPSTTTPSDSSVQPSAENSSSSVSEDDGSANSGSSMPSFSPQSSPMMSRSPSP